MRNREIFQEREVKRSNLIQEMDLKWRIDCERIVRLEKQSSVRNYVIIYIRGEKIGIGIAYLTEWQGNQKSRGFMNNWIWPWRRQR